MSIPFARRSHVSRVILAVIFALSVAAATPASAHAEDNDALPGVTPPASPFEESVSTTSDLRDVYRFHLDEGQALEVFVTKTIVPSTDTADVAVFGPGTTNLDDLASAITSGTLTDVTGLHVWQDIPAGQGGDYYLSVTANSGSCSYRVSLSIESRAISLTPTDVVTTIYKGSSSATLPLQAYWRWRGPGDNLPYTAISDQSWLSVEPTSGFAWGFTSQAFTLHVNVGALPLGSHDGTVTVGVFGAESVCRVTVRYLDRPTISTNVGNIHVNYGTKVTLTSALRDSGGSPFPGRQVALQRSYNGSSWTTVTAPVSPTGSYSVVTPVYRKTYFRWVFGGGIDCTPCVSGSRLVESYASVGRPNAPKRMRPKRRYLVWGTLRPAHRNGSSAILMQFQCYRRGRWRSAGSDWVQAFDYEGYSLYGYYDRYSKGVPRRWRARAVHSDGDHLKTRSVWEYYSVY